MGDPVRGSWGQSQAVCCFGSIPAVGMVPSICSRARYIALQVVLAGLPAHSLLWRCPGAQKALHHASRCAAGCLEESHGILGDSE